MHLRRDLAIAVSGPCRLVPTCFVSFVDNPWTLLAVPRGVVEIESVGVIIDVGAARYPASSSCRSLFSFPGSSSRVAAMSAMEASER
jgi:hypothetical protein